VKKHLLFVLIMLFLQSCAWIEKHAPLSMVGNRYMVTDIDNVVIHEGPSLKSPSFLLEKPEIFTILFTACPEGKVTCIGVRFKDPYAYFFKVRFDSEKEGYISHKYFYQPAYKKYLRAENYQPPPESPAVTPKSTSICDPIPWKEGSFKCYTY